MSINLHLLNSGGDLSLYLKVIDKTFHSAISQITKVLPLDNLDIVIFSDKKAAIPETGIGGRSHTKNLVTIAINPEFPQCLQMIKRELPHTLAHEMHHTARRRSVGYGETLLEAIISEGLAIHFDLELWHRPPPAWAIALKPTDLAKWLKKATPQFDAQHYNHFAWFYGSKTLSIPRWTGYALGYYLVQQYLLSHPDDKPSTLVNFPAHNFLASPSTE